MSGTMKCPACADGRAQIDLVADDHGAPATHIECLLCGSFIMEARDVEQALELDLETRRTSLPRLVAHLRTATDLGRDRVRLTVADVADPERLGLARLPSAQERIDRALQLIAERTLSLGETVELRDVDFARIGARTCYELWELVAFCAEQGWIVRDYLRSYDESPLRNTALLDGGYSAVRLLAPGFVRAEELTRRSPKGRRAFVAMWFADEMNSAWRDGLAPALRDCGYEPKRVDAIEHNEKICDAILAEIRGAALVVCDFTGSRDGVYFEAGFAMGLGIPVIWCCRSDHVDQLHFDTRQYNHIVWRDEGELRERLEKRIRATLPSPRA